MTQTVVNNPQNLVTTGSMDSTTGNPVIDKSTDSAKHTVTQAGSVWSYGTYPNYLYSYDTVTTASAATLAVLTVPSIQSYKSATVVLTLTTDTMSITGTNGTGNSQALIVYSAANPTGVAATGLASGTYHLKDLASTDLVFTKVGTNAVCTVDVDLKGA